AKDRELVGHTRERGAGEFLGDPGDLVEDRPRLDDGRPEFDLSLALAHAGLGRDRGDAIVGEDADIELAAPLDRLAGNDTAGLDGGRADPAGFERLEPELAEGHVVAAGRITSYAAFLAFSELDPLGHHGHRSRPPSSNNRPG